MLKYASEIEVNTFCAKICSLFNPKFSGSSAEQDAQSEIAFATTYDFAKKCELTAQEFILAFHLASEGKLKTESDTNGNSEIVKLYREIDIIKLGEIKSAYIRFKTSDEKYKKGKNKLRSFLTPPPKQVTPEEMKELTMDNIKKDYHRFKADGKVLATPVFFDLIKKKMGGVIKLDFVDRFLKNFIPEVAEGKLTPTGSTQLPKIIKKDVYVEFQDEIIKQYIMHLKINNYTETEWINHWEKLYDQNLV